METQKKEDKRLFRNQHLFYYLFLKWVRHFFDTDVLHKKIHKDKLDRPLIIVANHVSAWDPFLIFSIIDKSLFFKQLLWRLPAAKSQFKFFQNRALFRFLGVYPIKRTGDLKKSLETTFEILDKGHSTIFFPEAKKVMFNENAEPKRGIGYIIRSKKVYILPIFLHYNRRNKNKKGVKMGKARAVVGDIYKSEYFIEKCAKRNLHKEVMTHVYDLEKVLLNRFLAFLVIFNQSLLCF